MDVEVLKTNSLSDPSTNSSKKSLEPSHFAKNENVSLPSLVSSIASSSASNTVHKEDRISVPLSILGQRRSSKSGLLFSNSSVKILGLSQHALNYNTSAQSSSKKLSFLETLESVPRETDILALKKLANTMNVNTGNSSVLRSAFISFTKIVQDISSRANYWSWAPNYMTFLMLFVRGEFGLVTDTTLIKYVIHLFCLFSCYVCQFDQEREPSIYNYFINFFIPQLIAHVGEWETDEFDPATFALSYIFYKIPVDESIIDLLHSLRVNDLKEFYRSSNNYIRQQRAVWLSAISYQLILNIKRGDSVEKNKANILRCYEEALLSHECERVSRIAKTYERYFDIKSQE